MSKKLIASAIFAVAFAVTSVASAAYDLGPTTLKFGMKNTYVSNLQTALGVTPATGYFGPITLAKVKAFQASNSLVADGFVGMMTKAKINAGTTTTGTTTTGTTTTGTTTLSGGAGDLKVTASTKNVESTVKEGTEEKVLALKLEAEDSDIQLTNIKLHLTNATSADDTSEKIADYIEEVKVYVGSKEVGSVDASDFSRESGLPDEFTKSLSLNGAIVKDGNIDYLYVAVVAIDSIDSDDENADWKVTVESVRFVDGTGAIMSDDSMDEETETFDFKLSSADDKLDIKSSSANPKDATIKVSEDDTTDNVLALAFKLDNDDDSSDMDLMTIKVTADTSATWGDAVDAEKLIDSVVLKLAGEEFEAEDLENTDVTSGTITYTFDIDGDVTLDAGDVEEAKVYVTFFEQGDSNYTDGTNVKFAVDDDGIEAEVDGDSVSASDINGGQTGAVLTLNSTAATVNNFKWAVSTSGTIIDFFFTVEADTDDFTVLDDSVVDSTAGNATYANSGAPVISKFSGTATSTGTNDFVVAEGDTATFRLRYTLTATAGDNGKWAEVTVTSVAGQTVPEDKETSSTATVNL